MIIALAVGAVVLLVGLSVRGLLRGPLTSRIKHHQGVREDKLAMFKAIRKSDQPINRNRVDDETEVKKRPEN